MPLNATGGVRRSKLVTPGDFPAPRRSRGSDDRFGGGGIRSGLTASAAIHEHGRTSKSDPLRVLFPPCPTPGRLGLTICPGKKGSSIHDYAWNRDLGMDLDRLVSAYHTKVLVCLLEPHEMVSLGVSDLVSAATERGIQVEHFPIPDLGTPKDMAKTRALVKSLAARLEQGDNVVIHCRGGNGRTGTIAACVLEELGMTPQQALKAVRSVRPKAVETSGQEAFLDTFAA